MTNNRILFLVIVLLIIVFGAGIFILNNKSKINITTVQESTPTLTAEQKQRSLVLPKKEVIINVTNTGFSPANVTVKKGSKVVWINRTKNTVTVNSDEHPTHLLYPPLNLGEFGKGSSVQLSFDKPGTYKYHNHLVPEQKGIIIVSSD